MIPAFLTVAALLAQGDIAQVDRPSSALLQALAKASAPGPQDASVLIIPQKALILSTDVRQTQNDGPSELAILNYPVRGTDQISRTPDDAELDVYSVLKKVAEALEVGEFQPPKDQRDAIAAAKASLHLQDGTPNSRYKAYQKVESELEDVRSKLRKETAPAAINLLQMRESDLEDRLSLIDNTGEIQEALSALKVYDRTRDYDALKAWRSRMAAAKPPEWAIKWTALASREGWRTFTVPLAEGDPLFVTSPKGGAKVLTSVSYVTGDIHLTGQYKTIRIEHPLLTELLSIDQRLWRANQLILSDGKTDFADGELLPSYIDSVTVVSHVEIHFAKPEAWKKVAAVLAEQGDVTFAGVPISRVTATVFPGLIAPNQYFVISATQQTLPESPEASSEVVFRNN